jgi:hypothetical protein
LHFYFFLRYFSFKRSILSVIIMARVIFGLVSLVCVLQTLAGTSEPNVIPRHLTVPRVPLRFRDLAAEAADPNSDILPPIASLNITAINDAVQSIGAINTG